MDRDLVVATTQTHFFALLNVAKAGTRPRGFDSDRYERAHFFGRRCRRFHRFLERGPVHDHVIGRKCEHGCGMIASRNPAGTESNRRCRVAFCRFGNDILFRKIFEQIANRFFLFDVNEN